MVDGDVRYDFRTLRARVIRLANALEAAGVTPGERVLWLGQNSHRILEGVLACARLGAMFCPVNWRQTGAELAFVLEDFQPKVVFWQDLEIGAAVAEARALAGREDQLWLRADAEDAAE